MLMNKKLPFLFALLLFSSGLFGQNRQVSGKIVSSDDGQPIAGVNVVIKGTAVGTSTDAEGKYSISAKSGDIIAFSFIGLITKEVVLAQQSIIDITMEVDAQQL